MATLGGGLLVQQQDRRAAVCAVTKRLPSACPALVQRTPCSREGFWPGTKSKHVVSGWNSEGCSPGIARREHPWCSKHTVGQAPHKGSWHGTKEKESSETGKAAGLSMAGVHFNVRVWNKPVNRVLI
eukprot:3363424-Heterocapsa_arctica.AAC.1